MSDSQILRFATAEFAAALDLDQDLDTIEPGKLADFVFLSGNPLVRTQDSLTDQISYQKWPMDRPGNTPKGSLNNHSYAFPGLSVHTFILGQVL